jgi:N-acyl-phosphatidylethanolamine-hydrolysing phospholipase D
MGGLRPRRRRWALGAALCVAACAAVLNVSCGRAPLFVRFLWGTLNQPETRPPRHRVVEPRVEGARLVATWVGHATVLLQLDDRFVLTDPVFTSTVGVVSRRYVAPGIAPEDLPQVDAVVVSHMHFDHLSLGSLDRIEDRVAHIVLPEGGLAYVPGSSVPTDELAPWESLELDGLRITATPVEHNGWRYAGDRAWRATAFTGYVIEYNGLSVYFGGDTAASGWMFSATGRRFPDLDLALLPIAPIHPREFMCRTHMDPKEALDAFADLGARAMIPIHFDTFFNSLDEVGEAPRLLRAEMNERGLGPDRVIVLEHGQQHVLVPGDARPLAAPERR